MRFAAFTFAFGCAVTVSGLPVDSARGNGDGLQIASAFQTVDISSDSSVDLGKTSLVTPGATPSSPFGASAPTDAATVSGGASAVSGPAVPTALAASAFSDLASLVGSGGVPALSDVAGLTSLLGPVPTDIASLISGAASAFNPSAFAASQNGSNGISPLANLNSAGSKGPRGALDPVAFAHSNETRSNNSAFNFFARDNDTLLGDAKTVGLNLGGEPKFNISVHEFGSESGFRRALDWILARSSSSRSGRLRRSGIARDVDLDLDLLH